MEPIPNDLLTEDVLGFIEPIELLRSVGRISKRFASIVRGEALWRKLIADHLLQLQQKEDHQFFGWQRPKEIGEQRLSNGDKQHKVNQYPDPNKLTLHQIQRLCIFLTYAARMLSIETAEGEKERKQIMENILEYGSVLPNRGLAMHVRQKSSLESLRTCLVSTTDQESEVIENVLFHESDFFFRFFPRNFFYWSSRPHENPNSNEMLVFTTNHPHTLMTHITIKPLEDPHFPDRHYTWKKLKIKAYHLKPSEIFVKGTDLELPEPSSPLAAGAKSTSLCVVKHETTATRSEDDGEQVLENSSRGSDMVAIEKLLANQKPVYESPIHKTPPADNVDWQSYKFPKGVIANVITIELIGKNSRQFDHSGYYACIQNLTMHGIPLYETIDEKYDYSTGKVILLSPKKNRRTKKDRSV